MTGRTLGVGIQVGRHHCRTLSLAERVLMVDGVAYCRPCGRRLSIRRRDNGDRGETRVGHVGLWSTYGGCR